MVIIFSSFIFHYILFSIFENSLPCYTFTFLPHHHPSSSPGPRRQRDTHTYTYIDIFISEARAKNVFHSHLFVIQCYFCFLFLSSSPFFLMDIWTCQGHGGFSGREQPRGRSGVFWGFLGFLSSYLRFNLSVTSEPARASWGNHFRWLILAIQLRNEF